MEPVEGARTFLTSGSAYDAFMGRYSRPLATVFVDSVGLTAGHNALDVGCGPGALTGVLVERLGVSAVSAFDPSGPFVAECTSRFPGVEVRLGRGEAIPFDDHQFDFAFAQLVLHFVSDPNQVANEMFRVLRPGGIAAACVWDFADEMEMLRLFWDCALEVDKNAPDEARTLRFGGLGEIAQLLEQSGFSAIAETTLHVTSTYETFDELWQGFLAGIGPAGTFCLSLSNEQRASVRSEMYKRLGSPTGKFVLGATARSAAGRTPKR
jgi:SAM-dependent methyltransferase